MKRVSVEVLVFIAWLDEEVLHPGRKVWGLEIIMSDWDLLSFKRYVPSRFW